MIYIKKNSVKLKLSGIENFESKLKIKLPETYKCFLIQYNGGVPEKNIVKSKNGKGIDFMIREFFGIGVKEDLMINFNAYSKRLPNECLPIASVEGGNLLCLNLSLKNYEYIYFWDHEEVIEENPIIEELDIVADSFNNFLNQIEKYSLNINSLEGYKVVEGWVDPDFLKKINTGKNK